MNTVNEKIHPVEEQWHYPILAAHGYQSLTKEAAGMVRDYHYQHPETGDRITCTTGVHGDYWTAAGTGGWWGTLKDYLKNK